MLIEFMEKTASSIYWDFFSTLVAMGVGVFFTWLFSKYYYSKGNKYYRKLNEIYSEEINSLKPHERIKIIHDEKGMPKKVYYENYNANASREIVKD